MRMMTKGWAAVTAMVDLAMHQRSGPVTLAEISERQKISLSYLEQLFGKLRRREFVDSVRGPGGGYLLARDMAQVSVAEIVVAVDEPLDARMCGGMENCLGNQKCITHELWTRLNEHISGFLAGVTLKQLVDEQVAQQESAPIAQPDLQRAAVRVPTFGIDKELIAANSGPAAPRPTIG